MPRFMPSTGPSAPWAGGRRVAADTPSSSTPRPPPKCEDGHYRPRPAILGSFHGDLHPDPAREDEVAARWVPTHHGIAGNENADEYARAAAEGGAPMPPVTGSPTSTATPHKSFAGRHCQLL